MTMKMKRQIFVILLAAAIAFSLAGCTGAANNTEAKNNPPSELQGFITDDGMLFFKAYEEVAQKKAEYAKNDYKDDIYDLKGLDYYYVPVYAEERLEFTMGRVTDINFSGSYNVTKPEVPKPRDDFMISVSRENSRAKERLAKTIDPNNYGNGVAPQLLIEGIYYEDLYEGSNAKNPVTQFFWLHEGNFVFMKLSKALMDEIREKDPEALKGPLFELRKVELK